ncbi:polyketide cyclase [Brachybacterium saurashtrense]|uniref:Polyketide cyclase n=1 Tax=Brachybacterium saurashtrense TaxID=556288 RepID=A0A345YR32_9MICO|nr:polyketide cyclase [Brachybacterium saurashtrense]AXK46384.1 polyketide cyclase [Brachybacterium saurashtrense]RRR24125.1 polyketide cyclase [Brachybacterium saurashtrense]
MADEPSSPSTGAVPDEIVRSVLIGASAERVFAIVREPGWFLNDGEYREHTVTRYGPVTQVDDPVHGSFQLAIEAHEPPHRIFFRWLGGGLGDISDAPHNTVEFLIDPAGTAARNLVRLTVKERGFAKLGLDESVRRRNYEENLHGWKQQLELAKQLAEEPRHTTPAEQAAATERGEA